MPAPGGFRPTSAGLAPPRAKHRYRPRAGRRATGRPAGYRANNRRRTQRQSLARLQRHVAPAQTGASGSDAHRMKQDAVPAPGWFRPASAGLAPPPPAATFQPLKSDHVRFRRVSQMSLRLSKWRTAGLARMPRHERADPHASSHRVPPSSCTRRARTTEPIAAIRAYHADLLRHRRSAHSVRDAAYRSVASTPPGTSRHVTYTEWPIRPSGAAFWGRGRPAPLYPLE